MIAEFFFCRCSWPNVLIAGFLFFSAWIPRISQSPLPNTPRKTIIGHYALGDAQVTWLGMYNIGRT